MATQPLNNQRAPMDFNTRSMRINTTRRKLMNYLITGLSILATILVIAPLVAILFYLLYKGAVALT